MRLLFVLPIIFSFLTACGGNSETVTTLPFPNPSTPGDNSGDDDNGSDDGGSTPGNGNGGDNGGGGNDGGNNPGTPSNCGYLDLPDMTNQHPSVLGNTANPATYTLAAYSENTGGSNLNGLWVLMHKSQLVKVDNSGASNQQTITHQWVRSVFEIKDDNLTSFKISNCTTGTFDEILKSTSQPWDLNIFDSTGSDLPDFRLSPESYSELIGEQDLDYQLQETRAIKVSALSLSGASSTFTGNKNSVPPIAENSTISNTNCIVQSYEISVSQQCAETQSTPSITAKIIHAGDNQVHAIGFMQQNAGSVYINYGNLFAVTQENTPAPSYSSTSPLSFTLDISGITFDSVKHSASGTLTMSIPLNTP